MTYAELAEALAELELPQQVTLQDIRSSYRTLVRRYHPDHGAAPDNERIRSLNAAYRLLTRYVSGYRYDFSREDFLRQNPEARLREQFYDSGLWGA